MRNKGEEKEIRRKIWLAMERREKAMQINIELYPSTLICCYTIRTTFKLPWVVNNQVLQRPNVCAEWRKGNFMGPFYIALK